jgi:hypothetical protein
MLPGPWPFRLTSVCGMLKRICAAGVLSSIVACRDQGEAFRTWEGCLDRDHPRPAVQACGQFTVRNSIRDSLRFGSSVSHTFPLGALTVSPNDSFHSEGAFSREGNWWNLQLGNEQPSGGGEYWLADDDGSFTTKLKLRGDSLVGTWERTCMLESCPETGTITLHRTSSR